MKTASITRGSALVIILVLTVALGGCDLLGSIIGSRDRPPIPEPSSYIGEVPLESEKLVVVTVPLSDFTPVVSSVRDEDGNQVATLAAEERITLVEEAVTLPTPDYIDDEGFAGEGLPLESEPQIQLLRYWVRIGDVQRYPGGTTTEVSRSFTQGSETEETYSFGGSIGVSVEASADAVFASVSTKVSTEFSYSNTSTSTVSESTTETQTFTVELEPDTNLVYAVWQLVEEYRIVHPDRQADEVTGQLEWATFFDDGYVFDDNSLAPLTVLTPVVIPETTLFRN